MPGNRAARWITGKTGSMTVSVEIGSLRDWASIRTVKLSQVRDVAVNSISGAYRRARRKSSSPITASPEYGLLQALAQQNLGTAQ